MKPNVFRAAIYFFCTEDKALIKKGKEVTLRESCEQFFSSAELSLNHLKKEIKYCREDGDEEVPRAFIEEIYLDEDRRITHIYDADLNYLGIDDPEVYAETSKFKKKDWVLFISGHTLLCGIIEAPADANGPALVVYEDSNINDCSPHAHVDEKWIVSTLTPVEAKTILPRKYYENILRRVDLDDN